MMPEVEIRFHLVLVDTIQLVGEAESPDFNVFSCAKRWCLAEAKKSPTELGTESLILTTYLLRSIVNLSCSQFAGAGLIGTR